MLKNQSTIIKEIVHKAETYLAPKADPQNVKKYSRYFKENYDAWGNSREDLSALHQQIVRDYSYLSPKDILKLGLQLFAHGKHEMGTLAIGLMETRLKDSDKEIFNGLKAWFDQGVNNWAHADYLCSKVCPWFLQKGIVEFEAFSLWIVAKSRWTRRAAPVSMIKIKKTADPIAMLDFIEPLMTDPERVVHQGTGWFLRELWKVYPLEVEEYLYHHRNTAARLIIQYATEKISKEERLRFRKDKKPK